MCWADIPFLTLCTCLIVASMVAGSLITEVTILTQEHLNKNKGCCTPTPPEDFKNCVTQKRRSLPASTLGFKSISCQCHATPGTTELRTRTSWIQTFRQCLLTDNEFKEEPLVKVENIFLACKHGKLVTVKHTIAKHPEKISEKSNNKRTPGMVAAYYGKTDVFNFLACRTCDWSGTDRDKNNILHLACFGGSLDIVNRVIRFADIESRGLVGRTCVLLAMREAHVHVANMLIKAGCNVTVVDDFENNLLHMACKSKSMKALRYIIAKGVLSLESRNSEGQTPLLLSVELGFIEGCKYLIAQGAAVATFDKFGKTILHCVMHVGKVNKKRIDMMRYFLSKGYVSKESKTLTEQQTPLLLAAWKGHLDLFKLLINEGCNTKAVDGRGDTILHLASDGGHYSMVKHILDKAYISPLARDSKGRTVLMSATHHGSIDIFKLLQRRGCNMTTLDDRGNSVLHAACSHGHVKMIEFILSRNELQVDMKGAHGYTPLMYAVRYGNVEAFKLMLRKGCSTKKRDDKGNTILHLACISGNSEIVKLLTKLKLAQPFTQDKNANNQTPKQLAEAKGFDFIVILLKEEPLVKVENIFLACKHGNLVTVKHMIAKQPEKISEKSNNKRTPGMVAAYYGKTDVFNFLACRTCDWSGTDRDKNNILHLACIGGSLNIVNRVIRFADIDSRGLVGRTCVLLAMRDGHVHVADILIKAGCNVTVVDDFENNLLHMACKSKSMKALRYIIAKGVLSLESRNSEGQTPLLLSLELGFIEGCKYLIAQGADVGAVDKFGKTILHCVMYVGKVNKKRIDMMRYFLSKGYVSKESKTLTEQQTPLLLAAWKGHLDLFKLLINEGCNTKAVDGRGDTILHLASDGGHYLMVKHILDKAYISPLARDSKGRTVLMSATHHGSIDIYKLLLRRGCNMTTLDDRGNSVLHAACSHGHVKMIKLILSKNELQVDMKGAHGYTPLMYAVRYGNVEAFKLMLRKGCSIKKTDDKGNTILHLACISENSELIKLLIKLKIAQPFTQIKNDKDQTPIQLAEAEGFDVIVNFLKDV